MTDGCPTPCDEDCFATCHEWHYVPWKRGHDPQQCEQRIDDLADPWARSETTAPERLERRA